MGKRERTPGRRNLDRQVESYLAEVEHSLLEATVHESQLEDALVTRTVIGQAVGVLMAQEGLTSGEAFEKLVHVSQNANIKLRDVAQRYVETWEEKVERNKRSR